MTDGRGPPPKGKGTLEEKTPALAVHRQRGSSDRQAATESERAEEDPDARPRLSRPFAEDPAPDRADNLQILMRERSAMWTLSPIEIALFIALVAIGVTLVIWAI